jgi:ribosomal protein L21
MKIIRFEIKGKNCDYFPEKKSQIIRIDYQRGIETGQQIIIDKITSINDEEFGQPYLKNIQLIGEVVNRVKIKITGMKYKPKKRYKKKIVHKAQYTEIKIVAVKKAKL